MATLGHLYIVSAPSGAGKTSLVNALAERLDNLQISVSHTTRKKRVGEVDGVNYHFISIEQFQKKISDKAFLEYAEVFGNYYGTDHADVERLLCQGIDLILEIDWQGARQIRKAMPQAISVFVLPPSLGALHERLTNRGQDDETVIAKRMQAANEEMIHYPEYQYLIINDCFNTALDELESLVISHRLTLETQQTNHSDLLNALIQIQ
ncbi:MAG: guanylate kinase [Gammaproteobacteria bacterium CG22_combo_CG10-13_8_21_14_all_40_8]|nr:MAG: guanylate kinase [Gammaproteobacteria bacterium CG22_combo_CG10-13_8_21_14_all_40_8]